MRSKISTATATATNRNRNRNRNSEPQRCKNLPYYLTATPTATLTATSTATPTAILNRNASSYASDRKPSQIDGKIKSQITFRKKKCKISVQNSKAVRYYYLITSLLFLENHLSLSLFTFVVKDCDALFTRPCEMLQ